MTIRHQSPHQSGPSADQRGLLDALRAEHAAIFGYGLVAAFSRADRQTTITAATAAHRARRDALVDALGAAGVEVPAAAAGYTPPFPVTDPPTAAKLAITIENDTTVAWRAALEQAASATTRHSCVEALTETALRLARWRDVLNVSPPSVAFPGKG